MATFTPNGPFDPKIRSNKLNLLKIIILKYWKLGAGKASAAIGFKKATEAIRKKPHISFKKPLFHLKCILKAAHSLKSLNFSEKVFKNNWNLYTSPTILNRSLHFSGNVFKKTRILWKSLTSLQKSLNFI
jgi:hypothetical protein